MNLFESGIEAKDFMAGGFGAFNEVVGQGVGIAVWARTSGSNEDLHFFILP